MEIYVMLDNSTVDDLFQGNSKKLYCALALQFVLLQINACSL